MQKACKVSPDAMIPRAHRDRYLVELDAVLVVEYMSISGTNPRSTLTKDMLIISSDDDNLPTIDNGLSDGMEELHMYRGGVLNGEVNMILFLYPSCGLQ